MKETLLEGLERLENERENAIQSVQLWQSRLRTLKRAIAVLKAAIREESES